MTIIHERRGGRTGTGTSTGEPAEAEAVFLDATLALLEPLAIAPGQVVVDVGPGAGSATVELARSVGEAGRVYAVDLDPAMLELTVESARAAGVDDRVRPVLHDLEDGPPPLPEPVDAVWSSWCVHHAHDWEAAVRSLARVLRPGGILGIAEGGLPTRCLPWDVGIGRPGLETRLDEAHDQQFTRWFFDRVAAVRPRRAWTTILADAGLVDITASTALLDLPAPLPVEVRRVVLDEFAARVRRAGPYLDDADTAIWRRLLDPHDEHWLGARDDLALLSARTAFRGRTPR